MISGGDAEGGKVKLPWCRHAYVLWDLVVNSTTCFTCDPATVHLLADGLVQAAGNVHASHVLRCEPRPQHDAARCSLQVSVALSTEGGVSLSDVMLDLSDLERLWAGLLHAVVSVGTV